VYVLGTMESPQHETEEKEKHEQREEFEEQK
jgi:hypothetical protein